ncbi:peroxygenase [Tripterygium wilfordii]|uniref:Peroxygenase n=1 Tax=Tripterygium wilfordii TaxID=458696 RepID=A0A7J7D7A7_TRIWF|nr:peroxygenase [Tripterygium wilfordii]
MAEVSNEAMATVAQKAPVTAERSVRSDLDTKLPKPYLPRAVVAPDTENINGTRDHKHNGMSVLQQHAAFFDQDNDGVIFLSEMFRGFRAIGFNVFASLFFTILIHGTMSYATLPNIHKVKHGSDFGTYDTEGRFIPANLENIFSKYAHTAPDKLTFGELWNMTQANRNAFDFFGWIASKLEWGVLYLLARGRWFFIERSCETML